MRKNDGIYDEYSDDKEHLLEDGTKIPGNRFLKFSLLIFALGIACLAAGIPLIIVGSINLDGDKIQKETYDFVIIGGGSAGCVMAEKLSRSGKYSVLLIEAGYDADDDPQIYTVNFSVTTLNQVYFSKYFWQVTQLANFAVNDPINGRQHYSTGRVLGGGSTVGDFLYTRGTVWQFDQWVNLTGEDIWNTSNVLQAYKDIETFHGITGSPGTHGENGRLSVLQTMTTSPQTTVTSFSEKVTTAWSQMTGLPIIDDYNNMSTNTEVGPFNRWQFSAYPNGTRSSASVSFLSADVLARKNLVVKTNTTALRIRFDENKHAKDVVFTTNGHVTKIAVARRRIIVCAGIYTAQMLQHSGIGDADYLSSIKVPVVYNNTNVGDIMYNQYVNVAIFSKNVSDIPSTNPADIFESGAFLPNPTPEPRNPYDSYTPSPRFVQNIGINLGSIMILSNVITQMQSQGYVRIMNNDPLRIPTVTDNLWVGNAGANDKNTTFYLYKNYMCGISNEFQGTGVGPVIDTDYLILSPSTAECADDNQLNNFINNIPPGITHHWSSSCRMGREGDGISVTNGKGSVHGVTGLTIADNSLAPQAFDGTPQAPAYLIAWIIADQILAENY